MLNNYSGMETAMKLIKTSIEGLLIIEPKIFRDQRGFFFESYSKRTFEDNGINIEFIQDNHSKSVKGTVRGLHFQEIRPQDKLVRAVSGEILDVAVDLRPGSPTFGKWESVLLSAENARQLLVPKGFAHGFCVLSKEAEFLYKCSDFYYPEYEKGIRWNDPMLNISWTVENPLISQRDAASFAFADLDFSSYMPEEGYLVRKRT